jgi:hypothetical protein
MEVLGRGRNVALGNGRTLRLKVGAGTQIFG